VAQFLGQVNILPLSTIRLGVYDGSNNGAAVSGTPFPSEARIYVRPHDLEIQRERNGRPCWKARIERVTPLGSVLRLDLTIDLEHAIHLELPSDSTVDHGLTRGDTVFVVPRLINVFDPNRCVFHPISLGQTAIHV
jgi:sulfate transport system ATP-binding protein